MTSGKWAQRKRCKKFSKIGKYAKKEKSLQNRGMSEVFEIRTIALWKQEQKELISKKICTISTFFRIWEDNISLSLLINITKDVIFSWIIKF